MTQKPYKIHVSNRGDLKVVVHGFKIGVIDREFMTYLEYRHDKFIMKEVGEHIFDRRIFQIATKEDIQRAGIWKLVINKVNSTVGNPRQCFRLHMQLLRVCTVQ